MLSVQEPTQPTVEIPQSLQITVPITDETRREILNVGACRKMAESYHIDCTEMAQLAQQEIVGLSGGATRIEALMNDLLVEPKRSIAKIQGWFKPAIEERKAAVLVLKNKLAGWMLSEKQRVERENREREEAERKARQEAQAKAAAEMARAEEASRAKLKEAAEAEEKRKALEAEGNARASQAAAAKAARLREEADAVLESGAVKAQQAHVNAAAIASAPVAEVQSVKGFSMATKWIAEPLPNFDDERIKAAIVAEAATRPELLALLTLERGICDRWAAGMKTAMRIPGMTAKETFIPRAAKK